MLVNLNDIYNMIKMMYLCVILLINRVLKTLPIKKNQF